MKASTELMSGFGVPSLTTTPTPTRARFCRLPATNLPLPVRSSTARGRQDRDVEHLTAVDPLGQRADGVVLDDDLVAGLLLELRHEREQHLLERAAGQHLDFGRAGVPRSAHRND